MIKLDKNEIRNLLPHREPMLIDEYDIKNYHQRKCKKNFCSNHFPKIQLCRVLIVESNSSCSARLR